MEMVLAARARLDATLVDITGGAPEMNGNLRRFVGAIRSDRCDVQVRTNLTVLMEAGLEGTIEFFRNHQVRLVASCATRQLCAHGPFLPTFSGDA